MRSVPAALALAALLAASGAGRAAEVRTLQAHAALLASEDTWQPGRSQWLALRVRHDPGWHSYWIQPGDSGLPTRIELELPAGFRAGEPQWPRPERIAYGELTNFGYHGELLVPFAVEVPDDAAPGAELALRLRARWLICEEVCIPDGTELALALPVATPSRATPEAAAIAAALAALPGRWPGEASILDLGGRFAIELEADPTKLPAPEVFPADEAFLDHARGQASWSGHRLRIVHERNAFFRAAPERPRLLLAAGPRREDPAWWLEARMVPASAAPASAGTGAAPVPAAGKGLGDAGASLSGWALALLGALLGGLLLNLMPCVFPVLSLKALAIAEGAREPARLRRHGLLYTAGVLTAFAVLGGLLLAARAAGAAVGWGFQLQEPRVVGFLALLMFVLGLGLLGVFTVGTRLMGIGGGIRAEGDAGAFLTGVLACVVASPCTAPFMGAALGLAVTLPAALALAVFLALGLGLALPLLALSLLPGLARRLPRPGRWMESFRQAMAFPLFGTALWLLWVLGHQGGTGAVIRTLAAMLAAAFALWLLALGGAGRLRRIAAAAAGALAFGLALSPDAPEGETPRASQALGEPFREERLAALRREGRPVLVNMTADWCITCKLNERVALSGPEFASLLERTGTAYLIGDWTRGDAAVSAFLARFGRSGVPLYALYPASGDPPELLPQLLTPRLVAEALRRAAAPRPNDDGG